ncbi:hypothetical protein IAG44_24725 [Streptomyces roseirectus]|uniref:Neocarzinostatin family protein n=1 Tax=Streptomyces roseirectus TaxID=2768066 RepID=A0A7H0IHP0_9ACTN|nr:hypothetical protein [Streptomyces roseirectus]QNP72306.1 hypothetical protein IAG44_24725 [Streptomyces roseirectus]
MPVRRVAALLAALTLLLTATVAGIADAAPQPTLKLAKSEAGKGSSLTVTGTGWPAKSLLTLLLCGRSSPERGVLGGTNSCANADGRAVTTDARGRFTRELPVVGPPVPCPCVVHAATATGPKAQADAALKVAGHEEKPLPEISGAGEIRVLTDPRLKGSSGLLTWFGAPPARTFTVTVGNAGTTPVTNPVFQVGTAHGVFAPQWDDHQWDGTLAPGQRARLELPFELGSGAHGDYTVSLRYGGKVLADRDWDVGRPWGVVLFWALVAVVVPSALFRIGMAIVDRVRPRPHHRTWRPLHGRYRKREEPAPAVERTLPWFAPDTQGRLSAPHDDRTTPSRKGMT